MRKWYVTYSLLSSNGSLNGTLEIGLGLHKDSSKQDVLEEALSWMYKLEYTNPMVKIDYIVSEDGEEIDLSHINYSKYSREYFGL